MHSGRRLPEHGPQLSVLGVTWKAKSRAADHFAGASGAYSLLKKSALLSITDGPPSSR